MRPKVSTIKNGLISAIILILVIPMLIILGIPVLILYMLKSLVISFWRLVRFDPRIRLEIFKWESNDRQSDVDMHLENIRQEVKFISDRVKNSRVSFQQSRKKENIGDRTETIERLVATVKPGKSGLPKMEIKFALEENASVTDEIYGDPEYMDTKEFDNWHYYARLYEKSGEIFLLDLNDYNRAQKSLWVAISFLRGDAKVHNKQLWCYIKEHDVWLVKYNTAGSASFGFRKKYTGKFARKYWLDA